MKNHDYKKARRKGDSLEVKLKDSMFNKIYHKEIEAMDIKQLSELFQDLQDKGLPISKAMRKKDIWW